MGDIILMEEKGIILPAQFNEFGKKVIELTNHLSTQPLWTQSSEHLLSVLFSYINDVKYKNSTESVKFYDLVQAAQAILEEYNDWESLLQYLLSTSDDKLKETLEKNPLFQLDKDDGQELTKRKIIMIESLNRLKFITNTFYLKKRNQY